MPGQKMENLLNLALDATEDEREKSPELDTGYDPLEKEWQVIVKYSGSTERIGAYAQTVTELLTGYAVVTVKESRLAELAALPEVEYIEKPKRLFFETAEGRRVSCIDPVHNGSPGIPPLSGRGVLIGIVDSGIDYTLPDFRNPDGTTRILAIWDQTGKTGTGSQAGPPSGYSMGREYTQEQINQALGLPPGPERAALVPVEDLSGHGTAVAAIAAGNGGGSPFQRGAAPEASLLIVKLGIPDPDGFPRTTELMMGLDYLIRKAGELQMPLAVNISFGNTYGSHDGTSLLERYIDAAADMGRTCICAGSGNEGNAAGHTSGRLSSYETVRIGLGIQERQTSMSIQIWKTYADDVRISLITPSGIRTDPLRQVRGTQRITAGSTEILAYYGEPSPYSLLQEIFIDLLPAGTDGFVGAGLWTIVLETETVVDGRYQMWLSGSAVLNRGTGFLYPSQEATFTIPSTAARVVTVGAYDGLTLTYADFSGRGSEGEGYRTKPDLAAPGVAVRARTPGGSLMEMTGTSFAVPFVTGGAALLMEWGIIKGNDPYLYGEKLKAYLRKGAEKLPGETEYPNSRTGYGALCVKNSIPDLR